MKCDHLQMITHGRKLVFGNLSTEGDAHNIKATLGKDDDEYLNY